MADHTVLDEALADIDHATSLTLRGEGELPEAIARLVKLRKLDLDGWRVSAVPPWLARLPELESLALGGAFGAAPVELPSVVLELPRLRELRLDNFYFPQLPDELARLADLEVLYLSGGRLTHLPSSLDRLTRLRVLRVPGHAITGLPPAVATLGTLEELDLGGNPIEVLPDWIGGLARLRTLGLTNTRLRAVPDSIGELTALVTLQLDQNPLARLPSTIGRLTRLEHLQAQSAELVEVPREIGALVRLGALYLGRNQLRALPDEVGNLARLYALGVEHNRLTAVPETLASCKQLRSLTLEGNTFHADEVARLQRIVAGRKKLKVRWPHTATAREPTFAQRTLAEDVIEHVARLGGRVRERETPGDPVTETLPSGDHVLPEAIRQWRHDITWPPGSRFRGTIMDGWGPVTLDTPGRVHVTLDEYRCARSSPYYPIALEEDHQVYYLCSLGDGDIADPWIYRLDGHGWDDDHALRTNKRLSQVLAKLKPVPGAELRAMVVAVHSETGAARVATAQTLAQLTAAKLRSLRSMSTLAWLLDHGAEPADPANDVAIRLAALTGLAKLGGAAAEHLSLVQRVGETHPDPSVRAACAKTAKKLAAPAKQ